MLLSLLLSVCCIYTSLCADPVLIITHAYNRPEFIAIQQRTFKAFLKDTYELVVFNDATTDEMELAIRNACDAIGIRCIRIPQEIHTRPYLHREPYDPLNGTNVRHANNVQYSCDVLGFDHDGIVCIIDSDMFLVRPFSINEYMHNKEVAGLIKRPFRYEKDPRNLDYICPALCFLHMNKLPDKRTLNFNCGVIEKTIHSDSGGWTYFYLKKHPHIIPHNISSIYSYQLHLGSIDFQLDIDETISDEQRIKWYKHYGFNQKEITFLLKKPHTFEYFLDQHFFHYHGGSNYHGKSKEFHEYKTTIFKEYIEDILSD